MKFTVEREHLLKPLQQVSGPLGGRPTLPILGNLLLQVADGTLSLTGHPKWKTVDLTALPPGWQVGVCVKAGMALDYKPSCTTPATTTNSNDGNEEYLNLLKQRLKQQ